MDKYPITKLIETVIRNTGLTRKSICHSMGYSNVSKAFQVFDNLIRHGHGASNPILQERLARGLNVDLQLVQEACAETLSIQENEARIIKQQRRQDMQKREMDTFKPHLWALTERSCPSPIFVVCFFGENVFRRVELPDGIESQSLDIQKQLVRQAAGEFFTLKSGLAGPFGKITGFEFRYKYSSRWICDVQGSFIKHIENNAPTQAVASLSISGKTVVTSPNGLLNKFDL